MKTAVAGIEENVKNYLAALMEVGLEPAVTLAPEGAGEFDALLLPGGGDIDPPLYHAENRGSREIDRPLDEAQLAMLDAFVRAGKPVLGICKGVQVINVYFGGGVIQHLATAEAHMYHDGDSVHECVSLAGTDMRRLYGPRYVTNSSHHQALGRMGEGLSVTAYAADGTAESAAHESLPVFGVQWHPERMCFRKARPDTADGAPVFLYFKALMEARKSPA